MIKLEQVIKDAESFKEELKDARTAYIESYKRTVDSLGWNEMSIEPTQVHNPILVYGKDTESPLYSADFWTKDSSTGKYYSHIVSEFVNFTWEDVKRVTSIDNCKWTYLENLII